MLLCYLSLVLAVGYTTEAASAKVEQVADPLQCGGCKADLCAAIGPCHNGITWDVCGCCEVCAKGDNDECGGPWNAYGKCGYGLTCLKDGRECPYIFNSRGTGADTGSNICDEYLFNELAARTEFLVGARPFSAGLLKGYGRDYLRSQQIIQWAIGRCVPTESLMNKSFKRQQTHREQQKTAGGFGDYMLGDQPAAGKPRGDSSSLMGKRLMLKGVLRGVEY